MKQGGSYKENIEFLIMMYKRELEYAKKNNLPLDTIEMYECFIVELETIIEFSK